MNLTFILALVISTIVPLIALWALRALDLYGTGAFRTVLGCFVWGLIAFGLAFVFNRALLDNKVISTQTLIRFEAPVAEEILKSLILLYLVRRPNFTYFVDGAIYGFASGIGFAIVENYTYVNDHATAAMGVAIARVLSTNLMHASASAMVGIAIGWARFHKQPVRTLATLGGYVVAMSLHVGYNNLVSSDVPGIFLLIYAIVVGFVSAGVIAFAIRRGLAEEKAWIEETLGEADRVTSQEAAVVNRMEDLSKLLAPLSAKFGQQKAQQTQKFLMLQAQLGIKRKTLEKLSDEKMLVGVRAEMDDIRHEMDGIRRSLGTYIMLYIRNIFPEDASPLFGMLETRIQERIAQGPSGGPSAFATLGGKISASKLAAKDADQGEATG